MAAGFGACSTLVLTNVSGNGDHAIGPFDHGASRRRGVWYRKSALDITRSDRRVCLGVGLGPQWAGLELCVCGLDWSMAVDDLITSEYRRFDEESRPRNSCAPKRDFCGMCYCRSDHASKDIPPARPGVLAGLCVCKRNDIGFLSARTGAA